MVSHPKILAAIILVAASLLLASLWGSHREASGVQSGAAAPNGGDDDGTADATLVAVGGADAKRALGPETGGSRAPLAPDTTGTVDDSFLDEIAPPVGGTIVFLQGVVADSRGRPVQGVEVSINEVFVDFGPSEKPEDPLEPWESWNGATQTTVTGSTGAFLFEDRPTRLGGTLTFGLGLLQFGARTQKVDPGTEWQLLTLPDPRPGDSRWKVTVSDQNGQQVLPVEARLFRERGRHPHAGARVEHGALIRSRLGLVEVDRLPPGEWTLTVRARNSLAAYVSTNITEPKSEFEDAVVLQVFDGADTEVAGPTVDGDGSSWVNPGSGLEEWLPDELLRMGEREMNRYFAQTLRLGHGDAQAAELEIDMEATAHASGNDTIYLESLSDGGFAWKSSIDSLTRTRWKVGARELLRLDLARLPGKDGKTVSLLPYLADGLLDVVIQDDTTVHDIRLRVIR